MTADCPKWDACNAAVCPALPTWRTAYHVNGDKVCHYLLASGKAGAEERFGEIPAFRVALSLVDDIGEAFPAIARQVRIAAGSGFKGEHLRKNRVACDSGVLALGKPSEAT